MTALFQLPKVVGLPGAKLTFSQTLTSTPQDTYQDESLDTAHANPVEADANGIFPPIYLDPTLPHYRVLYTTAADVLIYQVDDVPSNQNTQQSVRMESTNPFVFLYDTDGTSGSRKYRIRAAGAAFEVQAVNDAENVFTTILRYEAGVLYSNETEVAVTSAGSFTGTLSGMTAATTGTVQYRKINNLVSLWLPAIISGTSNAATMAMTGLPAALTPSATVFTQCLVTDAGSASLDATAAVLSSNAITFSVAKTDSVADYVKYESGGFTSSGTKGLQSGWCITYPLI
jgi:hypothetical protein